MNCVVNVFSVYDQRWTVLTYKNNIPVHGNGYINQNEGYWNGEVIENNFTVYPHGKGIWIFDDGRISKDAINGEPAFKRIKKFQLY